MMTVSTSPIISIRWKKLFNALDIIEWGGCKHFRRNYSKFPANRVIYNIFLSVSRKIAGTRLQPNLLLRYSIPIVTYNSFLFSLICENLIKTNKRLHYSGCK